MLIHAPAQTAEALERLSSHGAAVEQMKPSFEGLIQALTHKKWDARIAAAEALRDSGDVRAVEPLCRALSDPEGLVRTAAADALNKCGDVRAVEPLCRALSDPEWHVRHNAVDALRKIKHRSAVPSLIVALKDSEDWVVFKAIDALGEIGDPAAIVPLTDMMHHDDRFNGHQRAKAALALGKIGDPKSIVAITQALDAGRFHRMHAVEALECFGGEEAAAIVSKLKQEQEAAVAASREQMRAMNQERRNKVHEWIRQFGSPQELKSRLPVRLSREDYVQLSQSDQMRIVVGFYGYLKDHFGNRSFGYDSFPSLEYDAIVFSSILKVLKDDLYLIEDSGAMLFKCAG